MSTLLAVDGSSIFMRALSVLPEDKRTVDDLEYLTVGMLRKAVRQVRADYLVVALDSTEGSWRCNVHPAYKADRKYSDLRPKQLTPMILPRLQARGIATAYNAEMEADDLLCTLGASLRGKHQMVCYTRDSDMLPLTYMDNVSILWPENGGKLTTMDYDAAAARLGYPPPWLPSIRALTADQKDNMRALLEPPEHWRCPLNKPRAIGLMGQYGKSIWKIIESAQEGDGAGMRDTERQYLCDYADGIGAIWHCAQLRNSVPLHVESRNTRVSAANFELPRQ